jgi:hypothetical protein
MNTSQIFVEIDNVQFGVIYAFYVQANCGSEGFGRLVGPLPIVPY